MEVNERASLDKIINESWMLFKAKFQVLFPLALLLQVIPGVGLGIYQIMYFIPVMTQAGDSFPAILNAYLNILPFSLITGLLLVVIC